MSSQQILHSYHPNTGKLDQYLEHVNEWLFRCKYARILLLQFVFTKYVFGFRKYDGLNTTKYDMAVVILGGKIREAVICRI